MNTYFKLCLIIFYISFTNILSETIEATGRASGVVQSDQITLNFEFFGNGRNYNLASQQYSKNWNIMKGDMRKLGINYVPTSDYSVTPSGTERGREVYTAKANAKIFTNSLTKSVQISNRLDNYSFVRNKYILYNYSTKKIQEKINSLIDEAIIKAEENALKQLEENYFIKGVNDSNIEVDTDSNRLEYASRSEKNKYAGKKGYKFINLSVTITYELGVFSQSRYSSRSARPIGVSKTVNSPEKKQSIEKYRPAIRKSLVAKAQSQS